MAGLLARIAREESASERTCVVTGEKGPPDAMLRFALSPEGVVTPDIRRKLPGNPTLLTSDFAPLVGGGN